MTTEEKYQKLLFIVRGYLGMMRIDALMGVQDHTTSIIFAAHMLKFLEENEKTWEGDEIPSDDHIIRWATEYNVTPERLNKLPKPIRDAVEPMLRLVLGETYPDLLEKLDAPNNEDDLSIFEDFMKDLDDEL